MTAKEYNSSVVLTATEQKEAYENGYRDGMLVKLGHTRISSDVSAIDFPLGSWSQQNTAGYRDAVQGYGHSFVTLGIRGSK